MARMPGHAVHAVGPKLVDEQATLSLSGKQHAPSSCYTLAHLRQQALNKPPGLEALRIQPEVVPQREENADVKDRGDRPHNQPAVPARRAQLRGTCSHAERCNAASAM